MLQVYYKLFSTTIVMEYYSRRSSNSYKQVTFTMQIWHGVYTVPIVKSLAYKKPRKGYKHE